MASEEGAALRRVAKGSWKGVVSDRWMVGRIPSGGLVTALANACIRGELLAASKEAPVPPAKRAPNAHPDVLTCNVHFMSSTLPGPFTARVDVLKSGKTTSTCQASLFHSGKEVARLLCTCGDLHRAEAAGPNLQSLARGDLAGPPQLPPLSECVRIEAGDNGANSVRTRVRLMVPPAVAQRYLECRATKPDGTFDEALLLRRAEAVRGGVADYAGYLYLESGADPELSDAPTLLDASVPPILGAYVTGWVPTINWTVQCKHHPAPGPLRFRFKTSSVTGGFLDEGGELWDSSGMLVALSRQCALVGVSQSPAKAGGSKL